MFGIFKALNIQSALEDPIPVDSIPDASSKWKVGMPLTMAPVDHTKSWVLLTEPDTQI